VSLWQELISREQGRFIVLCELSSWIKEVEVRVFLTIVLFVSLSGLSQANAQEAATGGITLSVGFESFPGKTYYRLECLRYENGEFRDYKTTQAKDAMNSLNFTIRVAKMSQITFNAFSAGIEVGMSVPVSGYEKSWELPALTPDFSGQIRFPGFC
jgi:hypothetical protein